MRKILFKAKRVDNGEWIEGGYCLDAIGHPRITTIDLSGKGLVFNEVIPETVGQFTGLTDKNGKMIFEGDIVLYDDDIPSSTHRIFWDNKRALFFDERIEDGDSMSHYLEHDISWVDATIIIGNIFDNPELIS